MVSKAIKVSFLIHLFTILYANLLKEKPFHFSLMFNVLTNVSTLFTVMFGVYHISYHMPSISILWHLLMIIVASLGYIFSVLKKKFSPCSRRSWPTLRIYSTLALRFCALIPMGNIFLLHFKSTYNKKALFHNVPVHIHLNKMASQSERIGTCLMSHEHYFFRLQFLLIFGLRHWPGLSIRPVKFK